MGQVFRELWYLARRSHLYTAKVRRLRQAKRLLPKRSGWVIDIGAGSQPYRFYLAQDVRYVAMEYSPNPLCQVRGSILDLPFSQEVFDGAICTEVLEHVPEPSRALQNVNRILRVGGWLYLTVPMTWGLHYEPRDYFRFTKYGLTYLVERSGFEIVEIARIGGLFTTLLARLEEVGVSLLYRLAFPLKFLIGSSNRVLLISLVVFPVIVPLDLLASLLDLLVPGSDKDAMGWAVLAVKRGNE